MDRTVRSDPAMIEAGLASICARSVRFYGFFGLGIGMALYFRPRKAAGRLLWPLARGARCGSCSRLAAAC